MTTKLKGLTVSFDHDVEDVYAQAIVDAILMIKGVISVEPIAFGVEDLINRERIKNEIRQKIFTFIQENI